MERVKTCEWNRRCETGNSLCGFQEFNKGRTSSNSKALPTTTCRTVSRQFTSSKMKPTKVSLDDAEGIRYICF